MPNWCNNVAKIRSKDDALLANLLCAAQGKVYDEAVPDCGLLSAMAPLEDARRIGNMRMDRINVWGTKWDINNADKVSFERKDGEYELTIAFTSAWSPPTGAFALFCERYPDADAELLYFEPGMGFAGKWTPEGDECIEYDTEQFDEDGVRDYFGDELTDEFDLENFFEAYFDEVREMEEEMAALPDERDE